MQIGSRHSAWLNLLWLSPLIACEGRWQNVRRAFHNFLSLRPASLSNPTRTPMKNILIVVLLVATVALSAIAYRQSNQAAQNRAELAQVHTDLAAVQTQVQAGKEAAEKVATNERKAKAMQEALTESSKFATEKTKQAEQLEAKLTEAKTNAANASPMAGVAKMFKDPKMRELMKSQQKAFMGPMITKQYEEFFKAANLSAEDTDQLKKLMTDKMLVGADQGMAMLDDSTTAEERAAAGKKIKADQDDYDAQIKQLLGDNYAAYQSYEKTVPDRSEVNQFGEQLSGDQALTADQKTQLVKELGTARSSFKWTTDYTQNKTPEDGNYAGMFSEEKIEKFAQEKEQFDAQFLERAQKILTPEQAKQYAEHQKTQRDMQMVGMKMAASMFGK